MPSERIAFLDLFRGIILLLMIEGHVLRELLHPALQASTAFLYHEVLHGITGPGFLLGAGITFGITAQRRWNEYTSVTPALWKRVRRVLQLLALGYMLHLPFFSLSKTLAETTEEGWRTLASYDVLQCIGTSLLILQALLFLIRKERLFVRSVVVLMIGAVCATPLVWSSAWVRELPVGISMALQGYDGSSYPLFPNSAFFFAGAWASYELAKYTAAQRQHIFIQRLALGGLGLHIVGAGLEAIPVSIYPVSDFWYTSPNFFLIKLGGLFLLISIAWFLADRFPVIFAGKARWLLVLGRESLFVYLGHLLVLYGWILNPDFNLSAVWAEELALGPAVLVTAAMTALLAVLARGWNLFRRDHPILFRSIPWWIGITLTVEFLTRSY